MPMKQNRKIDKVLKQVSSGMNASTGAWNYAVKLKGMGNI